MPNLWTPPPGFFPDMLSWFHPGNIARFEGLWRSSYNCYWDLTNHTLMDVTPVCDGSAVGKTFHIWKDNPPIREFWGTITGCYVNGYQANGCEEETLMAAYATIGTGIPATIQDFTTGVYDDPGLIHPMAIRYGWLFSDLNLDWWKWEVLAIHWLAPP